MQSWKFILFSRLHSGTCTSEFENREWSTIANVHRLVDFAQTHTNTTIILTTSIHTHTHKHTDGFRFVIQSVSQQCRHRLVDACKYRPNIGYQNEINKPLGYFLLRIFASKPTIVVVVVAIKSYNVLQLHWILDAFQQTISKTVVIRCECFSMFIFLFVLFAIPHSKYSHRHTKIQRYGDTRHNEESITWWLRVCVLVHLLSPE